MLRKLFFITMLVSVLIKAQDHADTTKAVDRSSIHGAFIDVLHDIKTIEKKDPYNTFVKLNELRFKMINRELGNFCDDLDKYKRSGWIINDKYARQYYKFFCYNNPDAHKSLKDFFKEKSCPSFNPNKRVFTHDDSLRGQLAPFRAGFDVRHYDLTVRFDIRKKRISGSNTITFDLVDDIRRIQIDAHKQLHISSIQMGGNALEFERSNNAIFINLPPLAVRKNLKMTIKYEGKVAKAINPPWKGGFIWKKKNGKTWAGVTCEHLGSSIWWPGKDHPSDEPDSMDTHFEVPENLEVVSNGNMVGEEQLANKYKSYHWKVSYPINTYNVTFYIGDFTYFKSQITDTTGIPQDLEYYVLPKNLAKAQQHYKISEEVVQFYSKAFGEFPFKKDGFCLVESPYAGMEHQTAIAIGTKYGKEKRYIAVKDDYLIIHEAAHEWWGNSVTAKDMAHAWIQEGFATYAELMFIENKYGHNTYLQETLVKELGIYNIWPVVGVEGINDNTFTTCDIYDKGALFLHSLRTTINNDTLFFEIIKTFATRNKYKQVVTQDFLNIVNEFTKKDYEPFFKAFLYQAKVPTLEYNYEYSTAFGKSKIKYRWTEVPSGFEMPFALSELDGAFHRVNATTNWQEFEIVSPKPIRFVTYLLANGCPKNYTTYYYTKMVED